MIAATRRAAFPVHGISAMGDGGSDRHQASGANRLTRLFADPARAAGTAGDDIVFEYIGLTSLTVTSPITGNIYRFDRPGARNRINPKDRAWAWFIEDLTQI